MSQQRNPKMENISGTPFLVSAQSRLAFFCRHSASTAGSAQLVGAEALDAQIKKVEVMIGENQNVTLASVCPLLIYDWLLTDEQKTTTRR